MLYSEGFKGKREIHIQRESVCVAVQYMCVCVCVSKAMRGRVRKNEWDLEHIENHLEKAIVMRKTYFNEDVWYGWNMPYPYTMAFEFAMYSSSIEDYRRPGYTIAFETINVDCQSVVA